MTLFRYVYVLTFCVIFIAGGCATSNASGTNCSDWFEQTLNIAESLPVKQRYQKILERIAKGCPVIPSHLKEAAQKSLSQKGADAKRTLLQATASYVSKECMADDPGMTAAKLIHICFEEKWPDGDFSGLLQHADAATYLYCRALKIEWAKTEGYDTHGKKLLSNLLISNAALRETE